MFATANSTAAHQRVHVKPQVQNTGRSYMSAMNAKGSAQTQQRTSMGVKAMGSTQMSMTSSNFVMGSNPTFTPKQSMGIRQHKSLISAQMSKFAPAPFMGQQQVEATSNQFSTFKVSGLTSMLGKSFNRAGTALNSLPQKLTGSQADVSSNGMEYQAFRMGFTRQISPWHDIEPMTNEEFMIEAVIEIPQNNDNKFECATDERWNMIKTDLKNGELRKLAYKGDGNPDETFEFSGMPYAYGMIPRTFEDPTHKETVKIAVIGEEAETEVTVGGDNDPLDLYILGDRHLKTGQHKCKVIGVYHFVDDGEIDYKIVAIDHRHKDAATVNELEDLEKSSFADAPAKILNWLKYYKTVDNDGVLVSNPEKKYGNMINGRSTSAAEAMRVIKECKDSYLAIANDKKMQAKDEYKDLEWSTPTKDKEMD